MRHLLNTLYVTNPEALHRKKDDAIEVVVEGRPAMSVPFHLLDGVVLFGHVGVTSALLASCAEHGLSVVLLDEGSRFKARVEGPVSGNVLLRREQYRRAENDEECLRIAKRFVVAKIHNSRIVLQHYARDYPEIKEAGVGEAIASLDISKQNAITSLSLDELRGVEGRAARYYFDAFPSLLRVGKGSIPFAGRSRRPPRDPVNAALSLFYSLASRDVLTGCESVGLDPQMGYLHATRPGRASLALDLLEELRSPLIDRFVISLFNRRQLGVSDFTSSGQGVFFKEKSLKNALAEWQRKKREKIVHPFLREKVELGLIPFIQAQLLARYLRGDLDDYPAMLWR
jgi:CRISPR-associated protein Cas1